MANRVQFIIWLVLFSLHIVEFLTHRLEECCACFHNLFWHHPSCMRNHSFISVVDTECVFGSGWNTGWSETGKVFFQKKPLFLGTTGDEMRSETNLEWPGLVWLRTKFRICCLTQSLAIVNKFAYFCFRAFVLKSRWFLTPAPTEKLLYGLFSCWKENTMLTSTMLES